MTALEKIGPAPSRLGGTALYDWDRPGPGGPRASADLHRSRHFRSRDDAHLRRHLDLSRARERDPATTTTSSRVAWACARSSSCATARARSARCTTAAPIAAPRCAAARRAMPSRSSAPITAGTSSTPASCAACHGPRATPPTCAIRSTTSRRCRAWSPIAASSSARSTWMRCRWSSISARSRTVIDEWLDRNPGGKVVVCEANRHQVQGQLEARLRQFVRRLSRRLFAPLAAGDREPLRRRQRQGHVLLPQLARQPADVHALHRPRQSLQGQAAEPREAARAGCGRWSRRIPAWSTTRPSSSGATATARSRCSISRAPSPSTSTCFPNFSLLGNHIQVFEPVSVDETNAIWYGTMIVDADGELGDAVHRHQCAAHAHAGGVSRISARSTTSPISSRSSAASMAPEDEWVYMNRGLGIPGPHQDPRGRQHHGARHRRGVHARALQGMEAADEGAPESRDPAGAVR